MSESDEVLFLIECMARCLVDDPDAVKVDSIEQPDGMLYRLTVAPSDVGKIIGKQGRTANSIRIILGAAGMKLRRKHLLEIVE
jgi:uncharacterized protein